MSVPRAATAPGTAPADLRATGDDTSAAVSVVMPTLNQADYIGAAVHSVFSQGVPGLQLLVQDGGSVDGTLQLLSELASRHPALHYTSAADAGAAQAVNRAVERARGAVIGWLNSDDLYAPGAVARALAHLAAHPDLVAVYGEGEHITADGAPLGRYPTRGPEAALAEWSAGCPICQPTMFVRRVVFLGLGGLDTSLRTAFDFDLWFRLFKAYPGRIGFVPQVQALSRLHAGGITLRERELVALEGMAVLARHLGSAPPHWVLTLVAERSALHPFEPQPLDLRADGERLAAAARPYLDAAGAALLHRRLTDDRALQLSTPQLYATVYADGWAAPDLQLRIRQPTAPATTLRMRGRHASPYGGPLRLWISGPDGSRQAVTVSVNGPFEIEVRLCANPPDARTVYRVRSLDSFSPAEVEPGSDDVRRLAFVVEGLELV